MGSYSGRTVVCFNVQGVLRSCRVAALFRRRIEARFRKVLSIVCEQSRLASHSSEPILSSPIL